MRRESLIGIDFRVAHKEYMKNQKEVKVVVIGSDKGMRFFVEVN